MSGRSMVHARTLVLGALAASFIAGVSAATAEAPLPYGSEAGVAHPMPNSGSAPNDSATANSDAAASDEPTPHVAESRPAGNTSFASERASFSVRFRDIVNPYRVFLMTAIPGERVRLEVVDGSSLPGRYSLETDHGTITRLSDDAWEWEAPADEGTYRLLLRREPLAGRASAGVGRPAPGDAITLNTVVMVPLDELEGGKVNGYRVGDFPREPYRDLPQYLPPRGFIPLTPDANLQVSPHFTLAQFPCKGPPGYPKYVVLSEKLLLKLELLLERANQAGIAAPTFQVLSGFRSPWYNANIGRPRYSRHIYGDAADIYVDNDQDGQMDDLNGDGRIDLADATRLHRLVEEMDGSAETAHLIGGLGQYPTTPNHGPFIHVDTREYRARW